MTLRLEGKVAIVIGSARGIGKATAVRFAEEGARVIIADTEREAGAATAAELGAPFVYVDVSRLADAEAAVALAIEKFGRLDIMVQNAGILFLASDEAAYITGTTIVVDGGQLLPEGADFRILPDRP